MLTSINPKGQIEAYTDIGQFIGILPPDYPGVSVPKEASDSDQMEDEEVWRSTEEGNHFKFETSTGRITGGFGGRFNGKRIGTSWGGQNSKVRMPKTGEARMNGYWLRGLSESRQVQAINKVVDIKKRMKSSKEYYDDIQRQIEGKEITKKLGQNLLETAGLSDFKPDMTAEEYVMRCRPLREKKELTDLMAEARGWDENAGKLVEKNLSEDEKKVVEHFAKKYGLINTKGASVLDDRNLSGWDRGDAETWMSLKSKAMGGPDNGREISGLILHESGVKKDWLYDLPNTAWGRARVEREAVRREMEAKAIAKRKIDKDFSNGMITADEREEALKTAGLENFDPDMQPEDYVMKCGTPQRKYNLIDMKGLAMKWYENADKMVQEKWDDQDRKIAEYLADKYGMDGRVLSGLKVPDDYNPREWEPEDFNCWMDLKSKALGGTTSGKEVPKSILSAAGVITETPGAPAAVEQKADYDWYQPAYYGNMESFMADIVGDRSSYGHKYTKEEFVDLNQRFLDQVAYGKLSPNQVTYYGVSAVNTMRSRMGLFGLNKPSDEMLSRLSDKEKQTILDMVNEYKDYGRGLKDARGSIESVSFEDMQDAEKIMFRLNMNKFRSAEKLQPFKDYILAQEKMLIGAKPSDKNEIEKKEKEKEASAQAAEVETRKRIKEEQAEFRNSDQAKAKAETIERIKNFNPDELEDDTKLSSADIASKVQQLGLFTKDSRFKVDVSIPRKTYVKAVRAYQNVVSKFPFLAGELGGFGDNYRAAYATAACSKMPENGGTEIKINFREMEDSAKFTKQRERSEAAKWHVPVLDSVSAEQATISHELGHAVANWLHRAVYGEFKATKVRTKTYYDNEVATLLKDRTLKALGIEPTLENIRAEVSEYAAATRTASKKSGITKSNTKADEFFAECFCELVCSKHPRRAAVEFGKQLEQFMKENGIDAMTTATTPTTLPKLESA